MKKYIIFTWLCLVSFLSNAQIITIKDKKTGEGIEKATLVSQDRKTFVVSNAQGEADISIFAVLDEEKKIVISMFGYQSQLKTYQELSKLHEILLEEDEFLMNEVVVSAIKWKQNAKDVPSTISLISDKDVAFYNPQTAADMLTLSGNVMMQKSQSGGGSPMIRGFAANRLLYAVDGIRMNTAIFRSGNLQNVISLDPFALENAEVLFGAGSVIYGSDAIGGVMSFQTIEPKLATSDKTFVTGKVLGRYSSANTEKTGHIDINIGTRKWAFVTSISANDFGDVRMGENGSKDTEVYLRPFYVVRQGSEDIIVENDDPYLQVPSKYSQLNLMQKVRFQANKHWNLEYAFHYSTTSDYDRYDRHIRYRRGEPRYGEWKYSPQIWQMNQLSVTHTQKQKLYDQLSLRLAQQYFEEGRISRDINDAERQIRTEKVDAYSLNIDFTKQLSTQNQLYYGVEYVRNNVNSLGTDEDILANTSQKGASRYPQADWSSYAIYAMNQTTFSPKFLVQTGLRYNQYVLNADFDTEFYDFPFTKASLNKGALTASIGAVYQPTKKWELSTNFSTGFRAPNVDDVGKVFDSQPGAVVVPNPSLSAEYAYNVDVAIGKTIGNSIKIDLTGYYTFLDNAMTVRNFTLNGQDSIIYDGELSQVQAVQNVASATVYGLQAGVEIRLPYNFRVASTFNYQKGEEKEADGTLTPSRHATPYFGMARLNYMYKGLQLELNTFYSGKVAFEDMPPSEIEKDYMYAIDEDENPYSPSWQTFNFRAMYQFKKYLILTAAVENITDLRYKTYSSGIAAVGRNFVVGATVKF